MKKTKLLILNERQCEILLHLLNNSAEDDSLALEKALPVEDTAAVKADKIELVDLIQRYPTGSKLSSLVNGLTLSLIDKINLIMQLEGQSKTLDINAISFAN